MLEIAEIVAVCAVFPVLGGVFLFIDRTYMRRSECKIQHESVEKMFKKVCEHMAEIKDDVKWLTRARYENKHEDK